jgi:hypothetical protein
VVLVAPKPPATLSPLGIEFDPLPELDPLPDLDLVHEPKLAETHRAKVRAEKEARRQERERIAAEKDAELRRRTAERMAAAADTGAPGCQPPGGTLAPTPASPPSPARSGPQTPRN